jgi:hypothetical protein
MAQEWDEKKEQELAQNEYMLKKDVYASNIRYNTLPGEILFFNLDYFGGNVTFTINKKGYKVTIEDDELGDFTLVNRNTDNSNFSQHYAPINSLTIYKTKSNGKSEEVFEIFTGIYKYSRHILSDVINLVLQSKIKSNEYIIQIEGKNVTINKKPLKADDNVVNDTIESLENQVRYVINTVKNKLDMLEQDFLSS